MPKLIPLTNFAKAGLNSDIMPWALPGDFLTHVRNIRIKDGKLVPVPAASVVEDLPTDFYPAFLMFIDAPSGYYWLIAGDDGVGASCVYVYDYVSFYDISLGPYVGFLKDGWQGIMLSGVPIINHKDNYPQCWLPQSTSSDLIDLNWDGVNTWRDVDQSAAIIKGHKQFLFALNLRDGLTDIPDGVRWSAPADVNSVPPTWDPLDTTNVAGFTTLGTDGGRIVDGLSLRDAFVVYREKSIAIFDYVGGQYVWQIRQLSSTAGLISANAVIEVNGSHYFIGDGDIYINNGNEIVSAIHGKIKDHFNGNYNSAYFYRSYVVRNDAFSEAWFCVPSSNSEYPDTAYVFNWRDNTWSVRTMDANSFSAYGKQTTPPITWDSVDYEWDTYDVQWGRTLPTPLGNSMYSVTPPTGGVGTSGQLILIDTSKAPQFISDSVIERVSYTIEGISTVTTISRIFPRIKGPGSVLIQLGSQDTPGSPIVWKDKELFNPNTDRSLTTRTTGQFHCFRIEGVDDTYWEFSGLDVEYVEAGRR